MELFWHCNYVLMLKWIVWNRNVYMYKKKYSVLNNLQWLICHKTKPNQTKPNLTKPLLMSLVTTRCSILLIRWQNQLSAVNDYVRDIYIYIERESEWEREKYNNTERYKGEQERTYIHTYIRTYTDVWVYKYIWVCVCMCTRVVGRAFANGPVDRRSIPSRVIPKTQKMALDAALLSTQHFNVRIKSKWNNPEKGVALSPISRWCSSYWKGSLLIALDNSQSELTIYIYICTHWWARLTMTVTTFHCLGNNWIMTKCNSIKHRNMLAFATCQITCQ